MKVLAAPCTEDGPCRCHYYKDMGCEASRVVAVEDKTSNGQKTSKEDRLTLTDLQVDCIRSTWPILAKDLTGNGCKVLSEVFIAEPNVKNMFPGYSCPEAMMLDSAFQEHGKKFMETIQLAAEHLEDREVDHSEVLMMLGAKHATVPGFDLDYLTTFTKALDHTWETVLGEEYTEDVREAWIHVFDYVNSRLRDGYLIYMDDRENENDYNDNDIEHTDHITTLSTASS